MGGARHRSQVTLGRRGISAARLQLSLRRGVVSTWLASVLHDVRYGARSLRRAAGFSFVAVLTLALGIGVNSAMSGVVDALLFRPPEGVADAGRVVRVEIQAPAPPGAPVEMADITSYPDYAALRDRA